MSSELGDFLRALLADSSQPNRFTPEQEHALLESLRAVVGVRLQPEPAAAATRPGPAWGENDLLTIDAAAATLSVTPRWLYRHSKQLPFARKLSRKVLRFSRTGIARWLATKRP